MENRKSASYLAYFMLMAVVIASCDTEDEDVSPAQNVEVIVTDIGTPTGNVSSASIGASGGTVHSADGKLSVIIPADALSSNTTVTIQPITNKGPLGLGLAYRLGPEGLTFTKPVTLRFHYDDQVLQETPEDFLWIITQASNGTWNAMLKSVVDVAAKTVTIETTHFSDWSLGKFIELSLNPSSKTIQISQSVELQVTGFSRDKTLQDDDELAPLAPINSTDDALTPLTPIPPVESRLMNFRIKGWTLNGVNAPVSNSNGSLNSTNSIAAYTAPNKRPSINPVAVSVELESSNKEGNKSSYMLTSSISVVETDLYLLIKVDGQTFEYYQYGINGAVPPDPNNFSIVNCTILDNTFGIGASTIGIDNEMKNIFGMELHNPAEGDHSLSCFHTEGDDLSFMPATGTVYENERSIRIKVGTDCNDENVCGDISMTLLVFENTFLGEVQGYFSGTIYQDKQGYSLQCKSSDAHTIEGEFRLNLVK